ncbi:hypothetical protein U2426_04530, partial [Klebsiella pneumoniae]
MAEVPLPTPTDNAVPSTDIRDAVYAGAMLDKVVTSTELKYTDRLGGEHYTVDGIKAEGDKVVEETRQNLIPLSRQYMTLSDAQADIANIPEGSSTYVRSQDGSSLADEYINNGGTLTATGRHMPSQQAVIDVDTALRSLIDELPNDALFLFSDADGFHIADIALDQTGKPVLSLGRLSLSRNSGSVFDITDADGFTVSVDDLTNRVRALESGDILYRGISFSRNERNALEVTDADGFVVSIDDLLSRVFRTEQGKFVYVGQELQRSSENLFEITDVDGFSFALDSLIDRVDNLEKGDGNANNDLIARLESLAQSSRSSLSFPVSAPVAPLKTGVNIYIFYGQSLAIGDEAFTTVTRQPSQLGNVMLGLCVRGQYYDRTSDSTFGVVGGENKYYPLQEKRQNGADIITDPAVSTRLGETVASGFAETLKTLHNRSLGVINDEQTIIACSVTGAVGTSLSTLLKGATSTPYYQRLISCVQGHMQAAAAAGHTDVRVAGLVFLQGENDYGGTARESYLQML